MEITSTVEDYLKAIRKLARPADGSVRAVSTSALARRLGVSAPSVSAMFSSTDRAGLTTRHFRSVTLTEQGDALALKVVRRHRPVETLLYEQLGVPCDEVHEKAERIEHAVGEPRGLPGQGIGLPHARPAREPHP